ncbi:hypothetical protein HGRIS_003772 [Hohenbuehelia grisea]|uniref:DUF155 domain-containing protein n=1 Tax=Hohenbuehelia grisea TaxID=104357 RepID=A0ABR3JHF7_9AGAR
MLPILRPPLPSWRIASFAHSCRQRLYAQGIASFRCINSTSVKAARSSHDSDDPDDVNPKPKKPKATTPLRRSASDSLPIRSNPTPTRGDIKPVFTLATAERYLLPRLRASPGLPAGTRMLNESLYVPHWPPNSAAEPDASQTGEIFVFANGSFVSWGLEEAGARRFASEVIARTPNAEVSPLKEVETEELEFVTDPSEKTRLQGDLIILGQPSETPGSGNASSSESNADSTILRRYAFSQALSRSTALSALEVSLDDYLSSMALLPLSLEQTGKPGLGRTALIKKLGQLMKFRQGLNLNRENYLETPDFYWAEPELEGYFNSMSDALEIKARTTSVNDKITYAAEAQSVLRQLLTESSSHRMELVIIALIAVEVVVALIRDGSELWQMLTGSGSEHQHTLKQEGAGA